MDMGNFGFPNTMFGFTNQNSNSSEDSDSDAPYCYEENSVSDASSNCHEDSDTSLEDMVDATIDSVINVPKKKYYSCYEITLEDVREIEKDLDLYELISLIFLMFDDISYALQVIRSLIAAGPENFSRNKLSEWAYTSPENWKFKLYEALAIIQNYNTLIELGLCKEDINVMRDAPLYVNRLKKVLYSFVCKYLKRNKAQELINHVRSDAKFQEDVTINCDPMYIEFHILFWISQGYINIEREPYIENLTKHLMKDKQFLDVFEKINEEVRIWTKTTSKKSDKSKSNAFNEGEKEECYKIKDQSNPGLVLVINNANFVRNVERREELKDNLPKPPLSDRKGTEADAQNLQTTFEGKNYKVVVKDDIVHDKFVDVVYDTVMNNFDKNRHSVLVLCVLSHGGKGIVYGANSIPIKEQDVINSVSGYSRLIGLLDGIPKIIIIQACQGEKALFVAPEPELLEPDGAGPGSLVEADGVNSQADGLETYDPRDKVVCMATIEGFVALRGLVNGSPYIRELCRCIDKYHSEKHFLDIMTEVHRKLNNEKPIVKQIHKKHRVCMIPEIKHNTLCKSLYLTPKKLTYRH